MHNHEDRILRLSFLHNCKFWLFAAWISGLLLGIAFTYGTQAFSSLMLGTLDRPLSIVGLGTVFLLPYLLTAVAVWVNRPVMLIPLAFCKAFLFVVCAASVDLIFGNAGCIVRLLLLFSDGASLPVLFRLWLRCMDPSGDNLTRDFVISLGLFLLIGSIDYWVIAPFLALVI